MSVEPRQFLTSLFNRAVAAVAPEHRLPEHLPKPPKGKTVVVGAGKGAASMAKAVEDNWHGDLSGLVITRYEHGLDLKKIKLVEAGHPVPDMAGQQAADEMLSLIRGLGSDDLVICLISGGGSALLAKPVDGISLDEKKAVNSALLASGASISEMNTVRKKLSAIKGGQLALAAHPAKIVTFMISDVPGDDPSVIASGPTIFDETTHEQALRVLQKYKIEVPANIQSLLEAGKNSDISANHPAFKENSQVMIAIPQDALQAAASMARKSGITPIILGDSIEGEAKDVALVMAGITRQVLDHDEPARKPCVILSGGETTVTVSDIEGKPGRGGRNAEFLLAFALAMGDVSGVYALAADTDGIDGSEDNAGAIFDPQTFDRAEKAGANPQNYLDRHDAYSFFEKLDDLIITGPTRTNVNDFRAILILPTG